MQLLEGRKAVVTGGSRGIGREICLLLAENGADVALAYRKSTVEAEQLREEITAMGRSCIAVQADVSVSADVDRFVTQAAQALGGIDILVNCAGVFPQALIEDITDEDWSRVMRINLDGCVLCLPRSGAVSQKKRQKRTHHQPLVAGGAQRHRARRTLRRVQGGAARADLLPCKGAGAGRHHRQRDPARTHRHGNARLRDAGTPAQWQQSTPLGRFGDTADIAELAVFLASDKGGYITGAKINVNGGLSTG